MPLPSDSDSSNGPPPSPYTRRKPRKKRPQPKPPRKSVDQSDIEHRPSAGGLLSTNNVTPGRECSPEPLGNPTQADPRRVDSESSLESHYEVMATAAAAYDINAIRMSASFPTVGATPNVFNFDSAQNSPYPQRHPAGGRRTRQIREGNDAKISMIDWTPSSSDLEDLHVFSGDGDISGDQLALPVQLQRFQSMQSLRHRRDPHYQGVRSRRAKRVIDKSGQRNVGLLNIPQHSWRFFKDFVTTLIEAQWRYVITVFALSFLLCWFFFALLWYLIASAHGDLKIDPLTGKRMSEGPVPCVEGAFSFAGFLLLSIETQVSIGFGEKYPNEECPEAVFLMVIQIVIGIALEGAMVGIVYAKMVRPPKHSSDMKFSRKAVICQRNAKLCLVFRVCDARSCHVIDTRIQAYWFEERLSAEGEKLRQFQHSLKLDNNGRVFLIFPTTVCHVIDEQSPLYDMSAKDLLEKRFELVITLTGSSRSTGQMTQSRTSYLPKEISWGHRFRSVSHYDFVNSSYVADYDLFDNTDEVDTPLCSARRLDEVLDECQRFMDQSNAGDGVDCVYDAEHLNFIGADLHSTNELNHRIEELQNSEKDIVEMHRFDLPDHCEK